MILFDSIIFLLLLHLLLTIFDNLAERVIMISLVRPLHILTTFSTEVGFGAACFDVVRQIYRRYLFVTKWAAFRPLVTGLFVFSEFSGPDL